MRKCQSSEENDNPAALNDHISIKYTQKNESLFVHFSQESATNMIFKVLANSSYMKSRWQEVKANLLFDVLLRCVDITLFIVICQEVWPSFFFALKMCNKIGFICWNYQLIMNL